MSKHFINTSFLFLLVGFSFLLFSCEKNISTEKVTVVKDCTGTYIRYQEKDYQVCNISKLSPYTDGQLIKVSFNKINSCSNPDVTGAIICMMYHENEGWVDITSVN